MEHHMNHIPEIAIVHADTLSCLGLRGLLERMMPMAVIRTFHSFAALTCDTPDTYVHYFISSQVLVEHTAFFIERKHKTIVLTNGVPGIPQLARFHTLDIRQNEESLVRSLLLLEQRAHKTHTPPAEDPNGLSAREIEVLRGIACGCANKEIADRLNISLTTVISHRKNIMEKLNVRSVSGLTIYAVMNGYIEADRI